ncbi:hypothetical protein RRF57_011187 [Xylaria bambusicola]|uniref:Ribonuclease T2-like n=1 Tax=Xylaria bambusicola TaxID=326684 RepID=A0AAN7UMD3_9PEZI
MSKGPNLKPCEIREAMFSKIAATLAVAGSAAAASVSCPADLPYSCANTTVVEDLCCFESPGGAVLLTQFWDTAPSTGPSDSWTLHGLWPDNCDGSYEQNCDPNRAYTNITAILQEKAPCTLKAMHVYWKDYKGNDESFWEHEFGKHGTCMSTLEPQCYSNYQPTEEVADYFTRAVDLFKSLPTYDWLAAAGIVPSSTATYTLAAIQAALTAHHGHEVVIRCSGSSLNELWYHYRVRGSIQSGEFAAVEPVGSGSTCPKTGIKYLPKYATSTPTTTTTTTTTTTKGSTPTPTATSVPTGVPGVLAGKGYIKVLPDGFMISTGNWYRASGTPATFTATPNDDGTAFTLETSKGPCQILADASLSCAPANIQTKFHVNGKSSYYRTPRASTLPLCPAARTRGSFTSRQRLCRCSCTGNRCRQ